MVEGKEGVNNVIISKSLQIQIMYYDVDYHMTISYILKITKKMGKGEMERKPME